VITAIQNHVDLKVDLGDVVTAWLAWKLTNPQERKDKAKAKEAFDDMKNKPANNKTLDDLTSTLVKSVLNSNERLQKEIEENREKIKELSRKGVAVQQKEAIEKLEERVKQLENLSITTRLIDDEK